MSVIVNIDTDDAIPVCLRLVMLLHQKSLTLSDCVSPSLVSRMLKGHLAKSLGAKQTSGNVPPRRKRGSPRVLRTRPYPIVLCLFYSSRLLGGGGGGKRSMPPEPNTAYSSYQTHRGRMGYFQKEVFLRFWWNPLMKMWADNCLLLSLGLCGAFT